MDARRDGDDVCFRVRDHGPGIPADEAPRVFERFVQLDQSSTRRQGGTGLGLHLCKQLAQLLDGHIALEETSGGGCTFSLRIPVSRPVPPAERALAGARPEGVRARPAAFDRAGR